MVDRVVAHLKQRKLLSDERAAETYVSFRTGKRALGDDRLRAEMLRKGADERLVEEKLASIDPNERFKDMLQLLSSRCKPSEGRAKGGRLLYSRGFSEDEIESALDSFFGTDDPSD